ncbi:hypothetical protein OG851_00145 [Streptomyces sp. NBC_00161]|uniref:hypothetical protein n=1 Tax=Streptomyces sp. NBC_00161 TaxID=2975671 RepID=UPI00324F3A38
MIAQAGIVRSYTGARRHPWVLGKLGDWVMPFGPYTPAQLVVLGGGPVLLIKTFGWWSWAGPVPVVLWLVSVWAVRGVQIAGQNPFTALLGAVAVVTRHPAGRIGGRVARDRRPSFFGGLFVVEPAPAPVSAPAAVAVAAVAGGRAAGSGLDRLLAGAAGAGRAAA